jgi:hypothetical protein
MFRALHRYVVRKRFQKLIAHFDQQIAEARANHQPVKHLQKAKSEFVHQALERRA